MKLLSKMFYIITLILSHIMVGVVFYNYGRMEMGVKYEGYSTPANVSFFLTIPFLIAIVISLFIAWICGRKDKNNGDEEDSN